MVPRAVNLLLEWRDPRTRKPLLYLLLAFPRGTAYGIFLVTGLALGAGLTLTLVGIPLLAGRLLAGRPLGRFERRLANQCWTRRSRRWRRSSFGGLVTRLRVELRDGYTGRGLVYLVAEFPLGIAAFTLAATLVTAPFFVCGRRR